MIRFADYLTIDGVRQPVDDGLAANAHVTVDRVNGLLAEYFSATGHAVVIVTSGYRTARKNSTIPGAALHSKHLTAQACDLADFDGLLDAWCLESPAALERAGLWQEFPGATKGWTHLQTVPYGSFAAGSPRWFYP